MAKKRILLKIGSNTLTKETNHISRGKIEDIGMQIAAQGDIVTGKQIGRAHV